MAKKHPYLGPASCSRRYLYVIGSFFFFPHFFNNQRVVKRFFAWTLHNKVQTIGHNELHASHSVRARPGSGPSQS